LGGEKKERKNYENFSYLVNWKGEKKKKIIVQRLLCSFKVMARA